MVKNLFEKISSRIFNSHVGTRKFLSEFPTYGKTVITKNSSEACNEKNEIKWKILLCVSPYLYVNRII